MKRVLAELVSDCQPGFACGKLDNDGLIQIRMNNIETSGNWNWSKTRRIPNESLKNNEKYELNKGDVLFNSTNSPQLVGKTAYFEGYIEKCTFSNHFLRIRTNSSLDSKYLAYYLRLLQKRNFFRTKCKQWVNQASFEKTKLLKLEIDIPPLEEQRRIAKILDNVTNLTNKLNSTLNKYIELRDSYQKQIFGNLATNDKGWKLVNSNSVCKKITDGTHDTPKRVSEGVPFITSKNIKPFLLNLKNLEYVSEADHKEIIKRCNPEKGDVLFTNIGVNIGNAVINKLNFSFSLKNIALLKPDSEVLNPYFLEALLNNKQFKEKLIMESSKGGAQKFISLNVLRKSSIPLPPLSLQIQFAKFIKVIDIQLKNINYRLNDYKKLSLSLQSTLIER